MSRNTVMLYRPARCVRCVPSTPKLELQDHPFSAVVVFFSRHIRWISPVGSQERVLWQVEIEVTVRVWSNWVLWWSFGEIYRGPVGSREEVLGNRSWSSWVPWLSFREQDRGPVLSHEAVDGKEVMVRWWWYLSVYLKYKMASFTSISPPLSST
jgi:hypothetical protein